MRQSDVCKLLGTACKGQAYLSLPTELRVRMLRAKAQAECGKLLPHTFELLVRELLVKDFSLGVDPNMIGAMWEIESKIDSESITDAMIAAGNERAKQLRQWEGELW